ncbi:MAG: tetratricopeptide repeat protein [Phycisphaerales bacterium]|nr:MAG: tetratricopeptide repeat protein [Phycisphaerales bacterium]
MNQEEIEALVKKLCVRPGAEMYDRTLSSALEAQQVQQRKTAARTPNVWRFVMKNRRTKFATGAAIAATVIVSLTVLNWLTAPAWAIGQTVKALKSVHSLVICGVFHDDETAVPFTLSIRHSKDSRELFDMRVECESDLVVIRGKKAWVYWPDKNVVKIYGDVTTSYGMMRDLKWWYDLTRLNPWITGKVLAAAKHVAEDWEEVYGYDERTGRDSVFVTCTYEPESTFWFVCDLETKLIVEAKYWNWRRTDTEAPPAFHATSFTYNEDLDDALFDFQIPEGVEIIDKAKIRRQEQEARALSDRAERLFMEGRFSESIDAYQQVYNRFPELTNGVPASTALAMMASGYLRLGEPAKAVEVLRKQLAQYGHLEGHESTYYKLGRACLDMGDKEKALKAFEKCLAVGAGRHGPDEYPLKQAREAIAQIKSR